MKTITRRETSKTVYGYRQYGGEAIEVKKEEEVIELIKFFFFLFMNILPGILKNVIFLEEP